MPRKSKHKPAKEPIQVEHKVKAAGIGALVMGVLASVAYAVAANPKSIDGFPVWAQTLILAGAVAFVPTYAAYRAAHTTRSDVPKPAAPSPTTVTVAPWSHAEADAITNPVQLVAPIPAPESFTGDYVSPYTGDDVQDDEAPAPKPRRARKATR